MALPAIDGCSAARIPFDAANAMWALEAEMKQHVREHGDPSPETAGEWLSRREDVEASIIPCTRERGHDRPHRDAQGQEWWETDEYEDD